jgi:hypothetical protein
MMNKIIYTRPNGGVAVVTPAEGSRLAKWITKPDGVRVEDVVQYAVVPRPVCEFLRQWPVAGVIAEWAETETEWLQRVQARAVPADARDVAVIDEAGIPADRTFRDAWRITPAGGVTVDMPAAREIYRAQLRVSRTPLLAALDVAFMRALESGDAVKQAEIIAKKEALRAVTEDPAIDAAETPAQLKAVIPAVLR